MDDDAPRANELTYIYRRSLLGAPWEFKLAADGLAWTAGRASGLVRYSAIRRVRLSYKPVGMQTNRFLTEIWAEGAPRLAIASSSWKNMAEQERLDRPYADFVAALHRRILDAGAAVSWEQGNNPVLYWPGVAISLGIGLVLCALIIRSLQAQAIGAAAFVGAFLALLLWQGGNFFRRNRPGRYSPQSLPREVMPPI